MINQTTTYTAKSLLGLCLAIFLCPVSADNSSDNTRWKTLVGVIMPNNKVGSGATAITGGGQPWTTTGGKARVNLLTGDVDFKVRGLVFAGGNFIGTPGPVTSVVGTLVCDTNGDIPGGTGNSLVFDTSAVDLDAEGDARFHGNFGADLSACSTLEGSDIAFLIRNATSGTPENWLANGAVLQQPHPDDHD